ncbi:MAG: hypothetical protein RIB78_02975 [Gammaproteobacteria bacterium]
MVMMKMTILAMLVVCLPVLAETQVSERVGYAYDIDSGELLYSESHYETFQDGRIVSDKVTYRDTEGNVFAEKEVDYSGSPVMPDFNLQNFATGHQEIASKLESELRVVFTPNEETSPQSETIPLPEQGIIDAGFDRFIVEHWQELVEGKQMVRKMLIPSLKKFIDFRIYQSRVDSESGKRELTVEPNSVLIRFLADPLLLEYELDQPRLLSYEGKSNMRNEKGDNLLVRIDFPPGENKLSRK